MSDLIRNDILIPISSKRTRKEKLFKTSGLLAIIFSLSMLIILFTTIFSKGYSAFYQTRIKLDINFSEELIDPTGARDVTTLNNADYPKLISQSLFKFLNIDKNNPKASEIKSLISYNNFLILRDRVLSNPDIIGKTIKINLIASDDVDQMIKGNINLNISEENRKISDFQIDAINKLKSNGNILTVFNKTLFTKSDSREPEVSGVLGAIIGSFYCVFVAACISVPIGVFAAIFLQEFA